MKNKIYTLLVLLTAFSFFSCSNISGDKEADNSACEAYVSFSFGNERAIVSSAVPAEYTYTLRGTYNGNTSTFCEKLSYEAFTSESFSLCHGEWTFELTAYKENTAVY